MHTGEYMPETVFEQDGRYDGQALDQVFHLFRDWRRDAYAVIDPHLIDLLSDLRQAVGAADRPIHLICGYRTPETNRLLEKAGRQVSRDSLHTHKQAADIVIQGVSLEKLRDAAIKMKRGGVGFYGEEKGNFLHVDTGRVRFW
jgi:uncharacterized protein YcbK (DUF882 family)